MSDEHYVECPWMQSLGTNDCECELITKVREPLIEMIEDLVSQACYVPPDGMGEPYLDSMALSVYAEAMRFLAEEGRIKITSQYGRRVIAEKVKNE